MTSRRELLKSSRKLEAQISDLTSTWSPAWEAAVTQVIESAAPAVNKYAYGNDLFGLPPQTSCSCHHVARTWPSGDEYADLACWEAYEYAPRVNILDFRICVDYVEWQQNAMQFPDLYGDYIGHQEGTV